jgi:hypothetical protein
MQFKQQCEQAMTWVVLLAVKAPPATNVAPPKVVTVTPQVLPAGLPAPKLQTQPLRAGEAYTVWGASLYFRSPQHRQEVTLQPIAITGYVVKTNFAEAPRCAVHRAGMADPIDCKAAAPAFWLGDRPDASEADCIEVLGFASNYAQVYEAIRQADSAKPDKPYVDTNWGQQIPNPLPASGAKLTVRGNYGLAFSKFSSGAETDSTMGILDFADRDELEPALQLATLPGVKRKR